MTRLKRSTQFSFGQGEVIAIDGHKDSRMASIRFGAGEAPKRIMLKFAKLQIVEG